MQIRVVLQSGSPECCHCTTQDNTISFSQLMKTHVTILLARPGPPLSICLLYTILVGGHFPQKINNDFCLAFYINPSSMVKSIPPPPSSLNLGTFGQHQSLCRQNCELINSPEHRLTIPRLSMYFVFTI